MSQDATTTVSEELTLRKSRLASRRANLPSAKQAELQGILTGSSGVPKRAPTIPRRERGERAPLSFAQERLWFLYQMEPDRAIYNLPLVIRLKGAVNVPALEQSLREVARKHEALRTRFVSENGTPVQEVAPSCACDVLVVDLTGLPDPDRAGQAERLATAYSQLPFPLETGPVFRAALFELEKRLYILTLVVHHIAADGWSLQILMEELTALYAAYSDGEVSRSADPPVQYGDYAEWQRSALSGEQLNAALSYWKNRLHASPATLDLPTDYRRPAALTYAGRTEWTSAPARLVDDLQRLSRAEGATLFMTLLAAYQIVLSRYSGQHDILVGTPVASRSEIELERLIGFFANTLVLRTDLSRDVTIRELLAQVRETVIAAQAHQDVPFEKLVEELRPERSLSHAPLFQAMFILNNIPKREVAANRLSLQEVVIDPGVEKFDLTLSVSEDVHGLTCALSYSSDLFREETIKRMTGHWRHVLEEMAAHPNLRIRDLTLITSEERQQLTAWSGPQRELPTSKAFRDLFAEQAARAPDSVAVSSHQETITYDELNRRTNRLAYYLRSKGVGPESVVALLMPRGSDLLVAILGVLKAGAAYLPLDPAHPAQRHTQVLDQSSARHVITTAQMVSAFEGGQHVTHLMHFDALSLDNVPDDNLSGPTDERNLAYVIYTSGSTGMPKGAMVEHIGMLNHLSAKRRDLKIDAADAIAQTASQCFDISVWQFLMPLVTGGKVIVVSDELATDPRRLFSHVDGTGVTILEVVPSMLRAFLDEVENRRIPAPELFTLRWLVVAGEALDPELVGRWLKHYPGIPVLNGYGPTECSDNVTHHPIADPLPSDALRTPIGRPIVNTQLYVLDEWLNPAPIGVIGELFAGGLCLGRGYLHDPLRTALSFVPDLFSGQRGARLYRTGDVVRWTPDGTLDFLGRRDGQIKLRGNRVELGEIEAVLRQHQAVDDAAVVQAEEDAAKQPATLVAFVVGRNGNKPSAVQLQRFLRERLPEYMTPALFVPIQELPRTRNGKLDRRSLRDQARTHTAPVKGITLPRTLIEEMLAEIWKQILRIEKVSGSDNFFWLGGHSLLATQVVARLRDIFQVDLPVRALFESPTLAECAGRIEEARRKNNATQGPPLTPAPRDGVMALSFAQQRLWFIDQLNPNSNAYNVPVSVVSDIRLNVIALEEALSETVRRHETLRTVFTTVEGQPVQSVARAERFELPIVDLSGLDSRDVDEEVRRLAKEEALKRFDLAKGPLFRANLLRLAPERHIELVTLHHIITDGWSMGVLMQEVETSYSAYVSGSPSILPELPVQYADFAAWQRDWLTGDILKAQLDYWQRQLTDAPMVLALPTDYPRPAKRKLPGTQCPVSFSEPLSNGLRKFAREEGATVFMVLMAAFQILLGRYSGQDQVLVGTPTAGRGRVELENLIGLFVNMITLKADLRNAATARELVRQVRESALEAYARQDVPFDKIVEELKPERRANRNPIFQAILAFQNAPTPGMALAGVTLPSGSPGNADTKFDIELYFWETEGLVAGSFVFSPELFRPTTVSRMASHFNVLLESFIANPDSHLSALSLATETESRQITQRWNETDIEFPSHSGIYEIFEKQTRLTPDAIAIETEREQITYQELDGRADMLARYLRTFGVGPEVFVGILIERSVEMIVALLGVAKSGGAYVPINTADPAKRIDFILRDAQIQVLVTTRQIAEKLPAGRLKVICLDSAIDQQKMHAAQADRSPIQSPAAANLAYMMYTSGSTGAPKGVCISHRNILRLVKNATYANLTSREVFLQLAPISFDASTFEIWGSLLNGGRLVVFPPYPPSLADIAETIRKSQITTMWLTAGLFHQLVDRHLDAVAPLKQLLAGGEALSVAHVNKLAAELPHLSLINGYGPTETTTFAACHQVTGVQQGTSVPIGRPIANTRTYILNRALKPVGIGEMGQLFIGGAGLARGYLNLPDLTAERFLPDPFDKPAERLYATGDLARYQEDGNIEFLGRADKQIKLRGFRIELEEVEAVLQSHSAVKQVVVMPRDDASGGKQLVAYVVPAPGAAPGAEMLRGYVQERLPDYMRPSLFLVLDRLPLTPNGKLDKNALLALDRTAARSRRDFVAPKDKLQEQLIGIWESLLDVRPIGIQDDFFELGGHSLVAVQLIARIEQDLGKRLPTASLFAGATIERLSELLGDGAAPVSAAHSSLLAPIQPGGTLPPLFCVHAAGGTVFCYADLARHLGPDQPLYGIQAPTDSDGAVPTIETTAAEYVRVVRSFQPTGPYFLGGWSMGGVIAFEMARQLTQQDQKVALLFIVDAQAPSGEAAEYKWVVLLGSFAADLGLPFDELMAAWNDIFSRPPMEQLRRIWTEAKKAKLVRAEMTLAEFRKLFDRFKANAQMAKTYTGGQYPGRLTFFRAEEPEKYVGKARPENYTIDVVPTRGWEKWASGGVELFTTSGQHYTVMREPHVASLAQQLRVCIQNAVKES